MAGLVQGQTFIDTVKAEFQSYQGMRILFTLTQNIQGEQYKRDGRFEIFSPDSFAYENGVTVIKVTGNTAATFSPEQNHVILETYSPDMYNSLAIFTGNFNGVSIQVQKRTRDRVTCTLRVPDYDVNGTIWFNAETYLPERLLIQTETMDTIEIDVAGIQEITTSELMNHYQADSNWEILDLRE